jgi:hypothetical protein
MGTLTDEDLRSLLGEAAGGFAVPADGPGEVLAAAAPGDVVPLHRRRWVRLPAAAAVVAGAVLAGTLLGGGSDDALRSQLASGANAPRQDEVRGPAVVYDAMQSAPQPAAQALGGGLAAAPVLVPGAAPAQAPVADGARVVKKGAIALLVDDGRVSSVLTQVQDLAAAVGGVVATAETQESGPTPSGSVVLRVPVDRFEEVVGQVRRLDAEVRSATTSGQDVTAQYADLEAQLRTLTAARERFLDILSGARTIGDVLAVQQKVDEVTGRIDQLEGQRKVLADQSSQGTLEVSVTEEDDPVVAQTERKDGLGKALSDSWDGFTSGVEALVRGSGRAVLVLLCAAAALLVVRTGWRLTRRRLV